MTEQPQQQPGHTFTSGFDFLNHHLNMAMRYTERATPTEDKHIGHQTAFKLATQHTELARVGALASIAQQIQALGGTQSMAIAGLTAAVERLAVQIQEDRRERMTEEEREQEDERLQGPAQDLVAPLPSPEALAAFGGPQTGAQPPQTRFQQRQAERAAEQATPPDSKDR